MGSDIVSDLFGQIPGILIAQVCLGMLGLGVAFVYFAYIKPSRQRRQTPPAPAFDLYPEPTRHADYPPDDLPDLDLLVETAMPATPKAAPRAIAPHPYEVTLHNGQKTTAKEVVVILRDETDGRLMVQIGDKTYRTLTSAPDAKKQFVAIMKELSEVVAKPDDSAPAPVAEPEPSPTTDAEMPPLEDLTAVEPPPKPKTAPPPPITPDGKIPGALPSFKLEDNQPKVKQEGGLFRRAKVEYEPVPELNLGMAIETYLQHKLKHTPEYAGRNFHIHNTASGGVRIQIDDQFYDAVDEIADPEVRAFIQETILEWHDRQ